MSRSRVAAAAGTRAGWAARERRARATPAGDREPAGSSPPSIARRRVARAVWRAPDLRSSASRSPGADMPGGRCAIRSTTSAATAAAASAAGRAWRSARRWRCAAAAGCRSRCCGDGDLLMGVTALWTAVHYRIPLLFVVANNNSFFNDELHQDRMARQRDRPVGNRWIGQRIADPEPDLAVLARAPGRRPASARSRGPPSWRARCEARSTPSRTAGSRSSMSGSSPATRAATAAATARATGS